MNIKTRIVKLEQDRNIVGLAVIAINEGESREEAITRCFPDGDRPKVIIFITALDALI